MHCSLSTTTFLILTSIHKEWWGPSLWLCASSTSETETGSLVIWLEWMAIRGWGRLLGDYRFTPIRPFLTYTVSAPRGTGPCSPRSAPVESSFVASVSGSGPQGAGSPPPCSSSAGSAAGWAECQMFVPKCLGWTSVHWSMQMEAVMDMTSREDLYVSTSVQFNEFNYNCQCDRPNINMMPIQ